MPKFTWLFDLTWVIGNPPADELVANHQRTHTHTLANFERVHLRTNLCQILNQFHRLVFHDFPWRLAGEPHHCYSEKLALLPRQIKWIWRNHVVIPQCIIKNSILDHLQFQSGLGWLRNICLRRNVQHLRSGTQFGSNLSSNHKTKDAIVDIKKIPHVQTWPSRRLTRPVCQLGHNAYSSHPNPLWNQVNYILEIMMNASSRTYHAISKIIMHILLCICVDIL